MVASQDVVLRALDDKGALTELVKNLVALRDEERDLGEGLVLLRVVVQVVGRRPAGVQYVLKHGLAVDGLKDLSRKARARGPSLNPNNDVLIMRHECTSFPLLRPFHGRP